MISNICGIGAGYVGGTTLAVIAKHCPEVQVTVTDISSEVIDKWNSENLPIYEPGLDKIVCEVRGKNLHFTTDIDQSIMKAELIFISVNTPTKTYGAGRGRAPNLSNLEAAARRVARFCSVPKIVVEKSTVPIKAGEAIEKILASTSPCAKMCSAEKCATIPGLNRSVVISNPEFLAEGSAVQDLCKPDRVLIGGPENCEDGRRAIEVLRWIYEHWVPKERILVMSIWSSELSKLAANAFLAQRISSINTFSVICEKTNADVREVAKAIGSDSRIGSHFLNASLGFGGSCFRKDILNLIYICETLNLHEVASYWHSVIQLNDYQTDHFTQRVIMGLNNTLQAKRIAVFGFSFKANTHDTRDSAAIRLCSILLEEWATVAIYDPKAIREQIIADLVDVTSKDVVNRQVLICSSPEEAVAGAYAIVICTEWEEFKSLDYAHLKTLMNSPPMIFDGRIMLDHKRLIQLGFIVESVGLNLPKPTQSSNGHALE